MATRNILDEALKLPTAERGRIVRELIQSLEGTEQDEDPAVVETAWAAELELRATRAMRGESTARDLTAACDELDAKRRPKT